jgi:hypothetical protein
VIGGLTSVPVWEFVKRVRSRRATPAPPH